jgi:hypothetical protein
VLICTNLYFLIRQREISLNIISANLPSKQIYMYCCENFALQLQHHFIFSIRRPRGDDEMPLHIYVARITNLLTQKHVNKLALSGVLSNYEIYSSFN